MRAFVLLATLLLARAAAAHPVQGLYGPATADQRGIRSVRLGHGLANLDQAGRWRFVCPSTWMGPESPPMLGFTAAQGIVVVGAFGAFEVAPNGMAAARTAPGINIATLKKLIRAGDTVLALASETTNSVVYAFVPGGGQPVLEYSKPIHAITPEAEAAFYLATSATTAAAGIHLEKHALDGALLTEHHVALPGDLAGAAIALEHTGGDLYAITSLPADHRVFLLNLRRRRAELVATSTHALIGPVAAGDDRLLLERGGLVKLGAAGLEDLDRRRVYNCLEQIAGRTYACPDLAVVELGPGGAAQEIAFELGEVKGPRLQHLDPNTRVACEFEWSIFAGEARLDPTIPEETGSADAGGAGPGEKPDPGCSCTAARDPNGGGPAALLLAILAQTCAISRARVRRRG